MKSIGLTSEGNILVEMTNHEYTSFVYLSQASVGRTEDELLELNIHEVTGEDLTRTFATIRRFTKAKFAANDLFAQLRLLDDRFKPPTEKDTQEETPDEHVQVSGH
jgi:ABC-type branched-subunit amino acid transport system ATPase component